jgi:hypothetical protein
MSDYTLRIEYGCPAFHGVVEADETEGTFSLEIVLVLAKVGMCLLRRPQSNWLPKRRGLALFGKIFHEMHSWYSRATGNRFNSLATAISSPLNVSFVNALYQRPSGKSSTVSAQVPPRLITRRGTTVIARSPRAKATTWADFSPRATRGR